MNANDGRIALPSAGTLTTLEIAAQLIKSGTYLSVAGDERVLRSLPKGNWIGGTIPYFMGQAGGVTSREQVFVTPIPVFAAKPDIRFYDMTNIASVCSDAPENGFTLIIIPAFSDLHSKFAREAPEFPEMFMKPLVGWVAGIHLDDLGRAAPAVVNGRTQECDGARAIAVHIPLPDQLHARIDIVNLFRQGTGDSIRFPETGFSASNCLINGQPTNFAEYLLARKIDTRQPLVANYSGAMINVSFKGIDSEHGRVDFYAPVFQDTEYKLALPVDDYVRTFEQAMPEAKSSLAFCCNCILNYLYSGLEGKKTGGMVGPITFGEVAYQLVNQTLVYCSIEGTDRG